jgi:hypothetical protein
MREIRRLVIDYIESTGSGVVPNPNPGQRQPAPAGVYRELVTECAVVPFQNGDKLIMSRDWSRQVANGDRTRLAVVHGWVMRGRHCSRWR